MSCQQNSNFSFPYKSLNSQKFKWHNNSITNASPPYLKRIFFFFSHCDLTRSKFSRNQLLTDHNIKRRRNSSFEYHQKLWGRRWWVDSFVYYQKNADKINFTVKRREIDNKKNHIFWSTKLRIFYKQDERNVAWWKIST